MFEIDYLWTKNKIKFYCTISPGNEKARAILKPALMSVQGATEPYGEKWLSFFITHEPFRIDDLSTDDDKKINEILDKLWPKITEIVKKLKRLF